MRRRVQFSLLGLLLLTAAIAVGMKLWHGPHHGSQLFEKSRHAANYTVPIFSGTTLEFEYVNTLGGPEERLAYIKHQPEEIRVVQELGTDTCLIELYFLPQILGEANPETPFDTATEWIAVSYFEPSPAVEEIGLLQGVFPPVLNLVTNRGRLFRVQYLVSPFVSAKPIDPASLPDHEIGRAIRDEAAARSSK